MASKWVIIYLFSILGWKNSLTPNLLRTSWDIQVGILAHRNSERFQEEPTDSTRDLTECVLCKPYPEVVVRLELEKHTSKMKKKIIWSKPPWLWVPCEELYIINVTRWVLGFGYLPWLGLIYFCPQKWGTSYLGHPYFCRSDGWFNQHFFFNSLEIPNPWNS